MPNIESAHERKEIVFTHEINYEGLLLIFIHILTVKQCKYINSWLNRVIEVKEDFYVDAIVVVAVV